MLEKDQSPQMTKAEAEACKRDTKLDHMHCEYVADYSGHNSAPYGEGGPKAAGPSSHAPGTYGSKSSYDSSGY